MDDQEQEKWLQEIIDAEPEDGAFAGDPDSVEAEAEPDADRS